MTMMAIPRRQSVGQPVPSPGIRYGLKRDGFHLSAAAAPAPHLFHWSAAAALKWDGLVS